MCVCVRVSREEDEVDVAAARSVREEERVDQCTAEQDEQRVGGGSTTRQAYCYESVAALYHKHLA